MTLRWIMFVGLCLSLLQAGPAAARVSSPAPGAGAQVVYELRHDRSLPLRSLTTPAPVFDLPASGPERLPLAKTPVLPFNQPLDLRPALSPSSLLTGVMPDPLLHFEGIPRIAAVVPPDTNGDVGPNHYMQWVNLSLAIWDKTGQLLYGPQPGNILWQNFGGACEQRNDGDPIVLYDPLADRWLVSQFVVPVGGPYVQCVAVSATPDPTGAWNRYAFVWSLTKMNDYPKLGVWPDGYYLSVNQFDAASQWAGGGVAVLERDRMLQNLPARMIKFDLLAANANFGGLLPADLDGRLAPPPGAANPFVEWDDSTTFGGSDALRLWAFHADWTDPAKSTFGVNLQPNQVIATANVDPQYALTNWITQPSPGAKLDAISDRLMYRLQYRNFGDHQALVSNHTVDAGSQQAGIHWFELRRTTSTSWSLYQEGLHAPDGRNRWMGSIAMDGSGNIALGYSLTGSTTYPSIAYAGRLVADPLNSLPQAEVLLMAGGGVQGASRWGDYSMIAVDPVDECTFWYTQEYYAFTSYANWRSHIGAFRFPTCSQPTAGLLQGTVRSAGQPLAGAQVDAGGSAAYSNADGTYMLLLPAGPQTITVSAFAYQTQTLDTNIIQGGTILIDFDLASIPLVQITGTVTDGDGHSGLPLYARLDLAGVPASPLLTDPLTGNYQVLLPQGQTYTFNVTAVRGGYLPASRAVLAAAGSQNFALSVDPAACPLGYHQQPGACQAAPGGLVVGTVRDANIPPNAVPKALPGAVVTNLTGGAAATAGANPAGLYFLFAPAGLNQVSASFPRYAAGVPQSVDVPLNGTAAANFDLPAGYLQAPPVSLAATVSRLAPLAQVTLQVNSLGSTPAIYLISEFSGPPPLLQASGPFAPAGRRLSPKRTADLIADTIYDYSPPAAAAYPAGGGLLRAWTTGAIAPWGIGIGPDGMLWVGDSAGGDLRFTPDGAPVGASFPTAWGGAFAADLAYDPLRQRLWQVNAGGDNCIYALDPQLGASGERICPPLGSSQRGLAYDPRSQTFYSGSWNDAILVHFDRAGTILDSINLGINLAGLAFHPGSGRLFALSNAAAGYDIYVYDTRHQYALLGGFDLPGMTDYGQAGLELAADGSLWAADFKAHQVLQVASGEGPVIIPEDLPWLSAAPAAANLPPAAQQTVTLSFDASGLAPDVYQAYLSITTDTPYDDTPFQIQALPVTLTVTAVPWLMYLPVVGR